MSERILHVLGNTNLGGAESRIMDLYRQMDRTRIQFDFMVHSPEKGFFEDEILSMGGRVFRVPRFRLYNLWAYRRAWKRFFREHREFRAVHGHITSSAAVYLPLAKRAGVSLTIAHARSAGVDKGIKGRLTRLMRRRLSEKADYLFACSSDAAISVFGEEAYAAGQITLMPNAIDCDKFRFRAELRTRSRCELGVENRLVIGHVGSFRYAKNHEFLIRLFAALMKEYEAAAGAVRELPKPILCLFGDGPLRESIQHLTEEYCISDSVLFCGNRRDMWNYYSAMDYFVYPSHYEGMPGAVVEAQTNGLLILMSDTICDEVIGTELVKLLSLTEDAAVWAGTVLRDCMTQMTSDHSFRAHDTDGYVDMMREAGFDVAKQAKRLAQFYERGGF